ncbi:MAG: ABC transporter permease, partial [Erythrobacteraceae bacterium]|nr:ABC transporter permease [Erythrobacteraceae bacterium]
VISAYTSDGRIAADKLVVLEDPEDALPSYDAMLMLSPRIADDAGVIAALEPLIGAISVEAMREANLAVDREDEQKRTPKAAAAALSKSLRRPGLDPGPLAPEN